MTRVLFACTHNAGRSQMAAAFFNVLSDPRKASAMSAGTDPATSVHAEVIAAMREAGIDLASARPQRLTPALAAPAELLVTMGCDEQCPFVPGLERLEWSVPDPRGQSLERVRQIRDEIKALVAALVRERGWGA